MREMYRGRFVWSKGHQECVKRRAALSLAANGQCKVTIIILLCFSLYPLTDPLIRTSCRNFANKMSKILSETVTMILPLFMGTLKDRNLIIRFDNLNYHFYFYQQTSISTADSKLCYSVCRRVSQLLLHKEKKGFIVVILYYIFHLRQQLNEDTFLTIVNKHISLCTENISLTSHDTSLK